MQSALQSAFSLFLVVYMSMHRQQFIISSVYRQHVRFRLPAEVIPCRPTRGRRRSVEGRDPSSLPPPPPPVDVWSVGSGCSERAMSNRRRRGWPTWSCPPVAGCRRVACGGRSRRRRRVYIAKHAPADRLSWRWQATAWRMAFTVHHRSINDRDT